jgi:flagellar hook-length control protein FliK
VLQQPVSQGNEHSATSAGNADERSTTANKSVDMLPNADLKSPDLSIQQNIVSVQVTTKPIVADTGNPPPIQATQPERISTQSGTPAILPQIVAKTEQPISATAEPVEENPTNVAANVKFEAKPEQVATPREEQDTADDNLEQAAKDSTGRTTKDKSQVVSVPLAPFEKVLNPIGAAPAAEPTLQQPRQELHEVARQVMDGMIASTDRLKSSQVIITLKPEHLGEVTVKINVDGDRVTAAFHAASSEVRAILESSLPQLRQEMSQQGWKFDSEGVYGGMQQFLANQQQQHPTEQWQMFMPILQRMNRDEYDETTAFSPTGRLQVLSAAAVDYRV